MASIAAALEHIKGNPLFLLARPAIEQLCREHKHEFRDRELDTATTIAMFPSQHLRRWDVETNLRHLKITMNMDVLRCMNEAGVRKEVTMFAVVYNLVRCVIIEAARRQDVEASRISFADALYWMRYARPGDVLPELKVNPWRPDRFEPRCKKRRAKQYDLMNKPREELRKALKKPRKNA